MKVKDVEPLIEAYIDARIRELVKEGSVKDPEAFRLQIEFYFDFFRAECLHDSSERRRRGMGRAEAEEDERREHLVTWKSARYASGVMMADYADEVERRIAADDIGVRDEAKVDEAWQSLCKMAEYVRDPARFVREGEKVSR